MKKRLLALAMSFAFANMVYANEIISASATSPVVMAADKQLTEDEASELIKIESVPLVLNSPKLSKRYSAYKVIISSDYPGTLNAQSAAISNVVPGQLAYQGAKATAAMNWFWLFFPYIGIIIAPITTAISHSKNKKAEEESLQYPGQAPLADGFRQGENIEFKALVPIGQKPAIRLVFRDKANNLTFSRNSQ